MTEGIRREMYMFYLSSPQSGFITFDSQQELLAILVQVSLENCDPHCATRGALRHETSRQHNNDECKKPLSFMLMTLPAETKVLCYKEQEWFADTLKGRFRTSLSYYNT